MYEIKLKVNENGLITSDLDPIIISVANENKRVTLSFEVDESIDSTYNYLVFTQGQKRIVYRLTSKTFEVGRGITPYPGKWLLSFVATNEVISSDGSFNGSYIFASQLLVTTVVEGNTSAVIQTSDEILVKKLFALDFSSLEIPSYVETIGTYFIDNYPNQYSLKIGENVKIIQSRAFNYSILSSLTFVNGCQLTSIGDYAFNHVSVLKEVVFPRKLTTFGKYVFTMSSLEKISFEECSECEYLGSYCFWAMSSLKEINFPDHFKGFTGNTYCVKDNTALEKITLPSTVNTTITKNSIDGTAITDIVLGSGWNVSTNFINIRALTATSMENMFKALKDLSGTSSKVFTLGADNLAKLTQTQTDIALNKNWSLS